LHCRGIYEASGAQYPDNGKKPYIYSFLNWRQKAKYVAIVPFVGIILVLLLHFLAMLLYSLRLLIVSKCHPRSDVYRQHLYSYGKPEVGIPKPEPEAPEGGKPSESDETPPVANADTDIP
jgi:hypothetical protein